MLFKVKSRKINLVTYLLERQPEQDWFRVRKSFKTTTRFEVRGSKPPPERFRRVFRFSGGLADGRWVNRRRPTLSLSLSLSHTHTHMLSLSLILSCNQHDSFSRSLLHTWTLTPTLPHTHTHTHTHAHTLSVSFTRTLTVAQSFAQNDHLTSLPSSTSCSFF